MANKVYLVTYNGYFLGYGSYIYSLGVFDSYKKAVEAIDKARDEAGFKTEYERDSFDPLITEMDLNKLLKTSATRFPDEIEIDELKTDIFLGGYSG